MTAQSQREDDEPDTVDIEDDTEDVVSEEEMSDPADPADPTDPALPTDPTNPTQPGADTKRAIPRVRMPSKVEIIKAVESVKTESLDVDDVTREAARAAKTEDLD